MSRIRTVVRRSLWVMGIVLVAGLFLPERGQMPVVGAETGDWHPDTFWYYPWGRSGVHKGVDIFALKGTPVLASSGGLVLFRGELARGGKVVLLLGPKWRLQYYAHLDQTVGDALWLAAGEQLGTVGDSGNAAGKPPHLHYSLVSLLPLFWKADAEPQGWKKMFYLDPLAHFRGVGE
ncbi:M23 family metallopeptidase [Alcanivorax sp. DP30]|uniref:M23 family metallopeptidase n=1 Tax=Alcanivorax sp. DP30 TaxID=2606217 RepID=UPI00136C6AE5|nr:M23 family metallopeptidase [Alcanivorax sp. DP30]MZR62941.1 peptidoglycan DD-metalloendopeptidase family protein [Alcanivorax sp. DP30]